MSRGPVLITGANGFVGGALLEHLRHAGWVAVGAARNPDPGSGLQSSPSLDAAADWMRIVTGCTTVVHTAARVHVMDDSAGNPLAEFRRVNVAGTLNLARQAARAGVRRFVYISSIKVNGEETFAGRPFGPDDLPNPGDPYGVSKHEAELGLRSLGAQTGMEVVVVRPPLVYGPGVKANFRNLMRWVNRGLPLPFGAIRNRRSLVAIDNLADVIARCLDHPSAARETFLVSDDDDLSTPDLLRRVARSLGRTARLIPVPAPLLVLGARAIGKGDLARRLCGSLQVDISKTRRLLDWAPPVDVDTALARTARRFLEEGR